MQTEIDLYAEMERLKLDGSPTRQGAEEEVDAERQVEEDVDNVANLNMSVDDNANLQFIFVLLLSNGCATYNFACRLRFCNFK